MGANPETLVGCCHPETDGVDQKPSWGCCQPETFVHLLITLKAIVHVFQLQPGERHAAVLLATTNYILPLIIFINQHDTFIRNTFIIPHDTFIRVTFII